MIALQRVKAAALIACLWSPSLAAQQSPTWSADVAAIVHRSCSTCHRPGQPAPFSLLRYDDVFKKRSFIVEVIESG